MTKNKIKQMVIAQHANMSDGVRQCMPALPRNDREWAQRIAFIRMMGVK